MKPLIANKKRQSEAAAWHREVFAMFGGEKRICSLCKRPGAQDAAHVIPRSILGPLRYADPRLGRPVHRECHLRQEAGWIDFSLFVKRDAVKAHNKIAKQPLVMP